MTASGALQAASAEREARWPCGRGRPATSRRRRREAARAEHGVEIPDAAVAETEDADRCDDDQDVQHPPNQRLEEDAASGSGEVPANPRDCAQARQRLVPDRSQAAAARTIGTRTRAPIIETTPTA